jgi:hypothetical protein
MSDEWWTKPYKGGPLVACPGFPRPLYPPDVGGHTSSVDGPDVEAYKRTVWRAGRWPGPASNFDRAFSNGFSHGKSGGNVADSGIAGVQRQQHIDATGWVGEKTFNTLRSIRVPAGPHEGEMAMDANAANLIAQAWELYGGKEPAPPRPTGTNRQLALAGAVDWLGYKESPAGSNLTKFGAWYGMDGQPWCAMFVTYCFEVEAPGSPSFQKASAYAYVPYVVQDARNQRNGLTTTSSPIPGDLVCYDWAFDGTHDHIGLFEGWTSGTSFTAIEGNTGPADYSNGGQVMRCTRTVPAQGTVFVRVNE